MFEKPTDQKSATQRASEIWKKIEESENLFEPLRGKLIKRFADLFAEGLIEDEWKLSKPGLDNKRRYNHVKGGALGLEIFIENGKLNRDEYSLIIDTVLSKAREAFEITDPAEF